MRPEILFPLFKETDTLPGIGPRMAALIRRLAGAHVKDLLFHKPVSVIDRSLRTRITEAPEGSIVTIEARVEEHIPAPRQGFRPYKVRFTCQVCGLMRHEPDAVHCKACGALINIPNED